MARKKGVNTTNPKEVDESETQGESSIKIPTVAQQRTRRRNWIDTVEQTIQINLAAITPPDPTNPPPDVEAINEIMEAGDRLLQLDLTDPENWKKVWRIQGTVATAVNRGALEKEPAKRSKLFAPKGARLRAPRAPRAAVEEPITIGDDEELGGNVKKVQGPIRRSARNQVKQNADDLDVVENFDIDRLELIEAYGNVQTVEEPVDDLVTSKAAEQQPDEPTIAGILGKVAEVPHSTEPMSFDVSGDIAKSGPLIIATKGDEPPPNEPMSTEHLSTTTKEPRRAIKADEKSNSKNEPALGAINSASEKPTGMDKDPLSAKDLKPSEIFGNVPMVSKKPSTSTSAKKLEDVMKKVQKGEEKVKSTNKSVGKKRTQESVDMGGMKKAKGAGGEVEEHRGLKKDGGVLVDLEMEEDQADPISDLAAHGAVRGSDEKHGESTAQQNNLGARGAGVPTDEVLDPLGDSRALPHHAFLEEMNHEPMITGAKKNKKSNEKDDLVVLGAQIKTSEQHPVQKEHNAMIKHMSTEVEHLVTATESLRDQDGQNDNGRQISRGNAKSHGADCQEPRGGVALDQNIAEPGIQLAEPPKTSKKELKDEAASGKMKEKTGARGAIVEPMDPVEPSEEPIPGGSFMIHSFRPANIRFVTPAMIAANLRGIGAPPIPTLDIVAPPNGPLKEGLESSNLFAVRFYVKNDESKRLLFEYLASADCKMSFKSFVENDTPCLTEEWGLEKVAKARMTISIARMHNLMTSIEKIEKFDAITSNDQFETFCNHYKDTCQTVIRKLGRKLRRPLLHMFPSFQESLNV